MRLKTSVVIRSYCGLQTFFAGYNPFMYVDSAANINSNTLRFSMTTCVDASSGVAGRRRRSAPAAGQCAATGI